MYKKYNTNHEYIYQIIAVNDCRSFWTIIQQSYHIVKFVFTPVHSIQHLQHDINLILLIPSFQEFQTDNADYQVIRMERSTSPGDIAAKNIKAQVENMCVGDNSGFKSEYNVR